MELRRHAAAFVDSHCKRVGLVRDDAEDDLIITGREGESVLAACVGDRASSVSDDADVRGDKGLIGGIIADYAAQQVCLLRVERRGKERELEEGAVNSFHDEI